MKTWVTKKIFVFDNTLTPHIDWTSFLTFMNTWGRVVFTKDFPSGKVTVEVQSEEEVRG